MRRIARPEQVENADADGEIDVKPEEGRRQEAQRRDDRRRRRIDRRHAERSAKLLAAEEPQNDKEEAPDDRRNEERLRLRKEGYEQSGGSLWGNQQSAGIIHTSRRKKMARNAAWSARVEAGSISGLLGPPEPTIVAILATPAVASGRGRDEAGQAAPATAPSQSRMSCRRLGAAGSHVRHTNSPSGDAAHAQPASPAEPRRGSARRRRR